MQLPALPSAAELRELAGGLQLQSLQLPRLDMAALRERLPELSEREMKAAVAAAAAAAAAAVVSAVALARRRQRRRAAAAAAQQEEPLPETLGPCGVLLDPLAAPAGGAEAGPAGPAGEVTTLAALEQLPCFRVFAAPVLAVRVMHQGDKLAALHRSVLALRELKVGAGRGWVGAGWAGSLAAACLNCSRLVCWCGPRLLLLAPNPAHQPHPVLNWNRASRSWT